MFSERLIDDVEKTKERTACNFFKYPARKKKDGSEPTFEERYKRGAPKNRRWSEKTFLTELLADFAQIQNEVVGKKHFAWNANRRPRSGARRARRLNAFCDARGSGGESPSAAKATCSPSWTTAGLVASA